MPHPRITALLAALTLTAIALPTSAQAALEPAGTPAATAAAVPTGHEARAHNEVVVRAEQAPIRPEGLDPRAAPGQVAIAFAQQGGFGASAPGSAFTVAGTTQGARGSTFVRLQRTIDGIPLIGGDAVVSVTSDGRVRAATGKDTVDRTIDTEPLFPAADASQAAIETTAREAGVPASALTAGTPERWIFDPRIFDAPGVPRARLVWQVEVTSPVHPDVRQLVLVDARTGAIALSLDLIAHALERQTCDAALSASRYPCETPLDIAAGERGETDLPSPIDDVNLAHEYGGDAYDFFFRLFGRDSIDDAGMPLLSTTRFRQASNPTAPYRNAFWNGAQMTYGEGMVAQDVVAHELAHGVTEHRSPLYYYFQSGAINESISDIFGEFIDLLYPGGNDDPEVRWQIGEDIAPLFGFTLRSMKDPTLSQHPDRTGSPFFRALDEDRGGVHRNSGVGNKFAYLLTDGDTFNGQAVRGIGIEKVARIVYEAMPMLTSAADYQMLAHALRSSCSSLIGSFGITAGDCRQTHRAILATEMHLEPVNGRVAAAPICGASAADPASRAIPVPVWSEGFEDDPLAWERTTTVNDGPEGSNPWYRSGEQTIYGWPTDAFATSGTHNIWGDDPDYRVDASIAMAEPIRIPRGAVYLRFAHSFQFQREAGGRWDGGVLEYSTGGAWRDAGPLIIDNGYTGELSGYGSDNPLKGRSAFVEASRGYITTRADLSSLAGKDVRFRFRIGTNSTVGSEGWYIDDVNVYACPATPQILAVAPAQRSLSVRVALAVTPATPVTDVQYRLGSGRWRSTGQVTGRFTIDGLRPGTTHSVQVRVVSGSGRSAPSLPVSARTTR